MHLAVPAAVKVPVLAVLLGLLAVPWSPVQCAKPVPRREDVPLIKCHVCEHVAYNIFGQVQALRRRTAPKKVSEMKILEVAEKICHVKKDQGDWIQWIDIVESGDYLELKQQAQKGECGVECKTIEKACNEVMGFADTDVAETLHTRPDSTLQEFTDTLCQELTDSCSGRIPKIPKGRKPGQPFVIKSEKELERERMERNIEGKQEMFAETHPDAPRMPKMKLYSREDLMKKTMFTGKEGEEEEEEEEEEDDEEEGSSKLPEEDQDPQLKAISEAIRSVHEKEEKPEHDSELQLDNPAAVWKYVKRKVSSSTPGVVKQAAEYAISTVDGMISWLQSSKKVPESSKQEL